MVSSYCAVCSVAPLLISGIFGYIGGSMMESMGFDKSQASAFAGFSGFMATQSLLLIVIVISSYWRSPNVTNK